jgi:hypothetical protein
MYMEFPAVVDPRSGGMDAGFVYRFNMHMSVGEAPRPPVFGGNMFRRYRNMLDPNIILSAASLASRTHFTLGELQLR